MKKIPIPLLSDRTWGGLRSQSYGTSVVVRSSGRRGGGLQVGPLILGGQLSPESTRQSQQTGPPTESQSWVRQSRRVGAHRQTLGVLGEVLGLELLLQERRKQKGEGGESRQRRGLSQGVRGRRPTRK